jgi:hypothetical protein
MGELRDAVAVPGWYPSPDGLGQRWWDGARWTDGWMRGARHVAPADSRSPAIRLRDALARGWRPPARPPLIPVAATEQVYAHVTAEVLQLGGEPGGILGEPGGDAVPDWHRIDTGTVHLTSLRFACQLAGQFANIPYAAIADATCDGDGICVWQRGRAPVKLRVVDSEWHFVLFRWLAYGEPRAEPAA